MLVCTTAVAQTLASVQLPADIMLCAMCVNWTWRGSTSSSHMSGLRSAMLILIGFSVKT